MSRTFGIAVGRRDTWRRQLALAVVMAGLMCVAAPQLALAAGGNTVLSAGGSHSCAVKADGTPICWGDDNSGQTTLPDGIGTVKSISAGYTHSCAVETDGTPICWGDNGYGETTLPDGIGTVSSISAGTSTSCAVKTDGTPICWGDNGYGQTTLPDGIGTVSSISTGYVNSCAVKTDGTPICWGYDGDGETDVPDGIGTVSSLSTGWFHSCAVQTDGTPICWGYNYFGQTTPPDGIGTVSSISGGAYHTCALKTDHTPICWGDNSSGQTTPPSDIGTVGPSAPTRIAYPTLTGTAQVGQTLTSDHGSWNENPTGYSYSWQRCSGSPNVCTTITGTADADDHDSTYTVTDDDFGTRLRSVVTASNAAGSTTASSPRTATIGSKPVAVTRPTISGTAVPGQTLTADHGTWDHATSYSYSWQRCSGSPTVCATITGTTDADDHDATYTITDDDYATRLRVIVVASNAVGSKSNSSALTATIGSKPVAVTRPTISGTAAVGQTLTGDHGTWDHATSYSYSWQRCSGSPTVCTTITGTDDADDHDATYVPTTDDVGTRLRVAVVATNPVGSKSNSSSLTPAVTA